jgi:predicted TIM-barrel fold metal-dependent hydrolase
MPLIDLHCHFGMTPGEMAVRPPELSLASAYADEWSVEAMCFAATEAETDIVGGNARLTQVIATDRRFRGWLTLSAHQPDVSQDLARHYLVRAGWVGARFVQNSEGDAVDVAGGHVILNALRRYSRPVLITANSPATLHAAVRAAREFTTLRFLLVPQNEDLTSDALAAIQETLNISLLPSAAFVERDVIATAVAHMSERRVLWSSDWGRLHPAAALGMLHESALTGPQRDRIGYRNARELLSA